MRPRSLALALLLVLLAGCGCPERWVLVVHCTGRTVEVDCGTRENCLAIARISFSLGAHCQDGSVGLRSACGEE